MSVQRKVLELANEIRNTDEYQKLQVAKADVEKREAPTKMLQSWGEFQQQLVEKQQKGEEITPEEESEIATRFQVLMMNPYARAYIEAQYELMELLMKVQENLVTSLGLVEGTDEAGSGEDDSDKESNVVPLRKPKLWTPNS
ncbi:MAG: YlbF family regulator [Limnochordia bacterium]|nr:YlbF family regulator [Limnochordia bacterium]MDD2629932.1 YlbF family regulator [Limnochordia bacterium]MDD4517357.1 YlbF family regulator [Limnochordia bacterium]